MNTNASAPQSASPVANGKLLSYSDIRNVQRSNALQKSQVPVEHAVSLPMPTKRAGRPAYAFFAAPAARRPKQPMKQGAPDRWWLLDAKGGAVLSYALCAAQPFSDQGFETVTLPFVEGTLDDLKAALANLETQMNALVPAFFAGESGDASAKQAASDAIKKVVPEPLQAQYRALAPDFFAWLEG